MSSSRTDASVTLVDVRMPQMGVSVAEGTVVAWRVEVGDRIAADQTICEISTDKIDTEVPAPVAGVLAEVLVPVESTVSVGTVLARIAPEGARLPQGAAEPASGALADTASNGAGADTVAQAEGLPAPALEPSPQRPRYSPVVQRIAAEHGVDLSQITGTGRGGRVRKQDVLAFLDDIAEQPPLHIESPYRPEPVAAGSQLSRMRRQIGEHMKRSLETAAHCTTWIEVDMSRIEAARA
ncbi:MAG: E3 binding domain-containing protein, partial [Solirubrobacterales bacterium]|nr:E3 binding domain-containing protein [Solirubrobacterales bacterium]